MSTVRRAVAALAALATAAATLSLGAWQWGRAQQKEALQAAIEARSALPPLNAAELLAARTGSEVVHRRVVLNGRWDAAHTVFLDNRQMGGRVGFYVATPLRLEGAGAAVLVQRGWAPRNFQERGRLPPVETPAGTVTVEGLIAPPPAKLYELGAAVTGPIRQNLDLGAFRAETRLPLLEHVSIRQEGAASEGLARQWPQPGPGAGKNRGYAFQWWAMSGLVVFLYVWFQLIRPRRRASAAAPGA